jgi:hypothetical protein
MTTIYLPEEADRSGIDITYVKSKDSIEIGGWYDSCVGIQSTRMSFKVFCERLGIDLKKKRGE